MTLFLFMVLEIKDDGFSNHGRKGAALSKRHDAIK